MWLHAAGIGALLHVHMHIVRVEHPTNSNVSQQAAASAWKQVRTLCASGSRPECCGVAGVQRHWMVLCHAGTRSVQTRHGGSTRNNHALEIPASSRTPQVCLTVVLTSWMQVSRKLATLTSCARQCFTEGSEMLNL